MRTSRDGWLLLGARESVMADVAAKRDAAIAAKEAERQ